MKNKKVYVVVDGTNSNNYPVLYWVNEYTEDEFDMFWNNKITFSELVGMKRVAFDSVYDTEDEAYKRIEGLEEF